MNPIKEKLNRDYFLEKIEKLVTEEHDRLDIKVRRISKIFDNLGLYIDTNKIIGDTFWGYGIEKVANGIKTITLQENPEIGYLLTLFTLVGAHLQFFFLRLNYIDGSVSEVLNPLKLKTRYIVQATHSTDCELNIFSDQLDEPLIFKADNFSNLRYYSDSIHSIMKSCSDINLLTLEEKAQKILECLSTKNDRKGDLSEILQSLKINFIQADLKDYADYFNQTGFAKTALSKDGCYLTFTLKGIDALHNLAASNHNPTKDIDTPLYQAKEEINLKNSSKKHIKSPNRVMGHEDLKFLLLKEIYELHMNQRSVISKRIITNKLLKNPMIIGKHIHPIFLSFENEDLIAFGTSNKDIVFLLSKGIERYEKESKEKSTIKESNQSEFKVNNKDLGFSNVETLKPGKRYGKNYVLAIGINDYIHCTKLKNAVRDVEQFIEILRTRYDFLEENIILILDEKATYENILHEFRNMIEKVQPNDNLLIYYSGHGELDNVMEEGYWVPANAHSGKIHECIPNSIIKKILDKIESFHTFLIVDSCFSGSIFLEGNSRFNSHSYDFPSRWGLTSGRNTLVSDGKDGGNSPFSKALIDTLSQTQEPLNVNALCDIVKQIVSASTDQKQTPVGEPLCIKGHQSGQYVFYPTAT